MSENLIQIKLKNDDLIQSNPPIGDECINLNIEQISLDLEDKRNRSNLNIKEAKVISNINSISNNGNTAINHERTFKNSRSDLELSWTDLEVSFIRTSKKLKKKSLEVSKIQILRKVSGSVRSGECLAVVGSSGAGKTTLLNFLSSKNTRKGLITSGEYKLNGQKIQQECFSLISAYIMQDDLLEPTLTPLEILMFTAKLKLNLPNKEIERKVDQMLTDLNLRRCENTRVGSVLVRGVSGGERKRTSIGVELISDPKIIFLDEPTTGLDSFNAYEVILLLRKLSSQGKIILFTIHQPSSEIFNLLDKLCILALGSTVYFGPSEKSLDFFQEISLPVPNNYNPFEHFIEVTNISSIQQGYFLNTYPELIEETDLQERYSKFIEILSKKYLQYKDYKLGRENADNQSQTLLTEFTEDNWEFFRLKKKRPGIFYELAMLIGRSVIINLRNGSVLRLKIYQSLVSSVLISILFIRVSLILKLLSCQKTSVEFKIEMDLFL